MAHVGVERLGAGHREHDRAQREEGAPAVGEEEMDRVQRIDRLEDDPRRAGDVDDAEHRDGEEIDEHDRAEQGADPRRAARLDREQADQDGDRDRHDKGAKPASTVVRPSTADSTEMAGVIIESP